MFKRKNEKIDLPLLRSNLDSKGYVGGNKLISYLISQGKNRQEMTDICLHYTRNNFKKSK